MKNISRVILGIIIVFAMILSILVISPVGSVSAETSTLPSQLKANPCWNVGGTNSVGNTTFDCSFWGHTLASISVPYPEISGVSPEYGLVGVPTVFAVGWRGDTINSHSASPTNITIGGKYRFDGLKSELVVSAVDTGDTLLRSKAEGSTEENVMVNYDLDKALGKWFPLSPASKNYNGSWEQLAKRSELEFDHINYGFLNRNSPQNAIGGGYSFEDPTNSYILTNKGDYFFFAGVPMRSSYVTSSGGKRDGEPAFRVGFNSTWSVYAKVSWDSFWIWEEVGKDCNIVPVPTPKVGLPKPTPTIVCTPIYDWVKRGGNDYSDFRKVGNILTDYVFDPVTSSYTKGFEYLVYQSQPLLQSH